MNTFYDGEAPELTPRGDGGEWSSDAVKLWAQIWAHPAAANFTRADIHQIEMYLELWEMYRAEPSQELAAEIWARGESLGLVTRQ